MADLNTSEAQEPVAERLGVVAVHGLHLDFFRAFRSFRRSKPGGQRFLALQLYRLRQTNSMSKLWVHEGTDLTPAEMFHKKIATVQMTNTQD